MGFLTRTVLIKTYQSVQLHCPTIIGIFKFGLLPHFWQWRKSISNIGFACSDMALFWQIIFQPDGTIPLVTLTDQWEAILAYAWVKFYQPVCKFWESFSYWRFGIRGGKSLIALTFNVLANKNRGFWNS